jgi:hypothetical protein
MKPNYFIILVAISFAFVGCSTKSAYSDNSLIIDILKSYPKKDIYLQSIADIEYVALETTDDVLLGERCTLSYVSDNYIVVWEEMGDVFVFNKNGEIVTHFNNRGQGNWEYLTITGLVFDEKNEEIFVANMRSTCQIQVYTLTGKHKRTLNYSKDLELKIYDFDDEVLLAYDEKGLLPELDRVTYSKNPYMFLSKKDGSIVSILDITLPVRLPYNVNEEVTINGQSTRLYLTTYPRIIAIRNGQDFVISEISSDTIFLLDKNKELYPLINRTPSVHSSSLIKTLNATVLTDNFILSNLRIFDFTAANNFSTVIPLMHEFESGLTNEVKFVNEDYPTGTWNPERVSIPQKNVAAILIQIPRLYEAYEGKKLKGDLEKLVATLDEYANPIIMIAKFK